MLIEAVFSVFKHPYPLSCEQLRENVGTVRL